MSQKVVPLVSLAKTFDQHLILYMKFLKDVYWFIAYMCSELQ